MLLPTPPFSHLFSKIFPLVFLPAHYHDADKQDWLHNSLPIPSLHYLKNKLRYRGSAVCFHCLPPYIPISVYFSLKKATSEEPSCVVIVTR